MTAFIVLICFAMLGIIVFQISKVRELSAAIHGEAEASRKSTNRHGWALMAFMVVFLVATVASAIYYKDDMIGYGPWASASAHGGLIDSLINQTLVVTGIVFIATHIALFYFAYKYRETVSRKASYISHDNRLEIIWTAIPTVVMTYLVIGGLDVWGTVMADVPASAMAGQDFTEIEATGYQFAWDIRYPGEDGLLGTKNFRKISGTNPVGQDWEDTKNHDDFMPSEVVLPVGVPVRVRITSKDVLHDFYMPHFTVKMDAVPGMPTYFVFTPMITTDSMRSRLRQEKAWQVPSDPADSASAPRWKEFNFELACAELCGTGHFSMKKVVRIVSQAEFDDWARGQEPLYLASIRNTDDDPYKGKPVAAELRLQKRELVANLTNAISAIDSADRVVRLRNVSFESGSASLQAISSYELDNVVEVLKQNSGLIFQIAGHTDDVGDPAGNRSLSQARAQVVADYLRSKGVSPSSIRSVQGFGDSRPVGDNATEEGRADNRRTEFIVVPKPGTAKPASAATDTVQTVAVPADTAAASPVL